MKILYGPNALNYTQRMYGALDRDPAKRCRCGNRYMGSESLCMDCLSQKIDRKRVKQ